MTTLASPEDERFKKWEESIKRTMQFHGCDLDTAVRKLLCGCKIQSITGDPVIKYEADEANQDKLQFTKKRFIDILRPSPLPVYGTSPAINRIKHKYWQGKFKLKMFLLNRYFDICRLTTRILDYAFASSMRVISFILTSLAVIMLPIWLIKVA